MNEERLLIKAKRYKASRRKKNGDVYKRQEYTCFNCPFKCNTNFSNEEKDDLFLVFKKWENSIKAKTDTDSIYS